MTDFTQEEIDDDLFSDDDYLCTCPTIKDEDECASNQCSACGKKVL